MKNAKSCFWTISRKLWQPVLPAAGSASTALCPLAPWQHPPCRRAAWGLLGDQMEWIRLLWVMPRVLPTFPSLLGLTFEPGGAGVGWGWAAGGHGWEGGWQCWRGWDRCVYSTQIHSRVKAEAGATLILRSPRCWLEPVYSIYGGSAFWALERDRHKGFPAATAGHRDTYKASPLLVIPLHSGDRTRHLVLPRVHEGRSPLGCQHHCSMPELGFALAPSFGVVKCLCQCRRGLCGQPEGRMVPSWALAGEFCPLPAEPLGRTWPPQPAPAVSSRCAPASLK